MRRGRVVLAVLVGRPTVPPLDARGAIPYGRLVHHSYLVPLHGYDESWTDATGGGDSLGLYTPVGRESREPIVALFEHAPGSLLPIASSRARALALVEELEPEELGTPSIDRLLPQAWLAPDLDSDSLLVVDPESPLLLWHAAQKRLRERRPADAAALARRAIDVLPEYGAAWMTLAAAEEEPRGRALALARAVRCPLAFASFDRKRAVERLARSRAAIDDAVFSRRADLRGVERQGDPADAVALEAAASEDLAAGRPALALIALMTAGELMARDTHSCRERRGWTDEEHVERMRACCVGTLAERARFFPA